MGKMFFSILPTFAEFEAALLRVRTREAWRWPRRKASCASPASSSAVRSSSGYPDEGGECRRTTVLRPGKHERGSCGIADRDAHQIVPQVAACGFRHHRHGPTQGDELHQLSDIVHLGAGVLALHVRQPRHSLLTQVGHCHPVPTGQPVGAGQHDHLVLHEQLLGGESTQVLAWRVQQCSVCPTVAQHRRALADAAHDLHRNRLRLRLVGGEDAGQQATVPAGFHGQHEAGLILADPAHPPHGRCDRLQSVVSFGQQQLAGVSQGHLVASAVQQRHPEAPFELLDRPRQRRLRDAESPRRPAEVQFLGDRYEVRQLTRFHQLHTHRVSIGIKMILATRPLQWSTRTMSNDTTIALVTGANKGIGQAVTHKLARSGMSVLLGARDERRGDRAATDLRTAGLDVRALALDVTDVATIRAAVEHIHGRSGRLDVLINNAGVNDAGIDDGGMRPVGHTGPETMRAVFEVNVFGVLAVTNAMLPLLRRSSSARIVNVSSAVGSLANMTDPDHYMSRLPATAGYPPSKSALNALTVQYAKELRPEGILVNAAAPGACATDFTKHLNMDIPRTADDGAAIVVRLATLDPDGPTGGFFDDTGPVRW